MGLCWEVCKRYGGGTSPSRLGGVLRHGKSGFLGLVSGWIDWLLFVGSRWMKIRVRKRICHRQLMVGGTEYE